MRPALGLYVEAADLAIGLFGKGHTRTVTALREIAEALHDLQEWDEVADPPPALPRRSSQGSGTPWGRL